jgi:hypothetical protein
MPHQAGIPHIRASTGMNRETGFDLGEEMEENGDMRAEDGDNWHGCDSEPEGDGDHVDDGEGDKFHHSAEFEMHDYRLMLENRQLIDGTFRDTRSPFQRKPGASFRRHHSRQAWGSCMGQRDECMGYTCDLIGGVASYCDMVHGMGT